MTVCIPIKVVVPTATATFATSNETFSVSQTPSLSSSKVEDIEEESPKRKEGISGNHIIDVNILLGIFMSYMFECSSLALYERFERKQGLSSLLYLKCSTSSCRYIQEFFTSAKVQRF